MKWSRLRYLLMIVAGATPVAQASIAVGGVTGLEELELATLDRRQSIAGQQVKLQNDGDTEVVIVFFDEESVRDWPYLSPYPRVVLADLVDAVAAAGATAIGLDVFLDRTYEELNAREGGDDRLREAIENAGNVVLVADAKLVEGEPIVERPDPFFADVAADVAAADLPTPYETVRDGALAVRDGDSLTPSFSLALWAISRGIDTDSILEEGLARGRIAMNGMPRSAGAIPESGSIVSFPLRFVGPPSHMVSGDFEVGTFQATGSEQAAWLPMMQPDYFRDRIVLLGTGFHQSDQFRTPYYGVRIRDKVGPDVELPDESVTFDWMYGVEVHAHAIQNYIDGEMVRPLSTGATWVLLLAFAGVAGTVVFLQGTVWGAVASVVLTLGLFSSQLFMFADGFGPVAPYLWVPIVPTTAALWIAYLGATAFVSIVEGREKRYIRSAFGMYVSPAVVGEIAENPEALRLGGQKRPITVLFSDLAGFTTMSEQMTPEALIAHLNDYLTDMTQLVMDEGGTLDKYIGDAIMAFWNAPNDIADHAHRAMRCAVLMQRKMEELNARWREDDPDAEYLVVRIGINTGDVVVGNVGGTNRFDYSAIGDAVNLGARLEPANKSYDTLTMVSEFTLQHVNPEDFRLRELDFITVKGKEEPVAVFELLEMAGVKLADETEEALAHYDAGMKAYKSMDWELAQQYFAAAVEADPKDGPSRVYLDRCRENIANPPPADWDFVVRREVK